MRVVLFIAILIYFSSCWTKIRPVSNHNEYSHVWGNKPIYGAESAAKKINYLDTALPVIMPGNIYVKGDFIYQLEIGKGIHIINNTVPSQAQRIGFISVNGSSQISIKGNYLYTNSYDDLVVIDISINNTVTEVKRVLGAFPEGRSHYFYIEPLESGYYECPRYDSMVIGWRKDSIWTNCYKN